MAHKVIVPPKKNYIPQFLKQRDINSYYNVTRLLYVVVVFHLLPSFELILARELASHVTLGEMFSIWFSSTTRACRSLFASIHSLFLANSFSFPYELYCTTYRTSCTVNLCLVSIKYKNPYWTYITVLRNKYLIYRE